MNYNRIRGGAFFNGPKQMRAASRGNNLPEDAWVGQGFRCVINRGK